MAIRPEKCSNLLIIVRRCVEVGNYRFSNHALDRKQERGFILPDIIYVLKHGYHEKAKDVWDLEYATWKYAVRGKTIDGDEARIVISIDESGMLIITVIRLGKEK